MRQRGICIKFSQRTSVNAHNNKENRAFLFSPVFLSYISPTCQKCLFLSFFPKNRHFEMGSNCDVLTLKRTSFSTFFVVGRSNHLPTTSAFFRQIPSVSIYTKKLEINLTAMSRGFESHRLRQKQYLAGCCLLFLRQTMQGLQGGIRTARARRSASRRAATVLRTVARARENPTACAKYHYSISHWVVIFLLPLCKILVLFL